jgi:hypothetical protein
VRSHPLGRKQLASPALAPIGRGIEPERRGLTGGLPSPDKRQQVQFDCGGLPDWKTDGWRRILFP